MSDTFKAVAQAVRKIICRIDPPLCPRSIIGLQVLRYPVGRNIPHLGVRVLYILLHTELSALRRILAIPHAAEFCEVSLNVLLCMHTTVSRGGAILTPALQLGLSFVAVTDIGTLLLDKLLSKVVQALEVVRRIGDL